MNYYDDVLEKINKLINEGKEIEALEAIKEELNVPYIPKDIENKLNELLDEVSIIDTNQKSISDDEIINYLHSTKEKQLIAVESLTKKNLRDYLDVCNEYLCSNGFKNAKVLLIDSLIQQDINDEIKYIDDGIEYTFIPRYVIPIEESDGFLSGKKYLCDVFMKEPSKLKMALDLLFKEAIMKLPINLEENEGIIIAKDIKQYIDDAFLGVL